VACTENGPLEDSRTGLRVVWDSPVLEVRERRQLEQLLTRVLREALWEMLKQQHLPRSHCCREEGGDDNAA
jgi:hypothetical protein